MSRIKTNTQERSYDLATLRRSLSGEDVETLRAAKRDFIGREQRAPLIVYDMDDILHLLLKRICTKTGIDFSRACVYFNVRDNDLLSKAEQDVVYDEFTNPDNFLDIDFIDGASEILRPMELGAEVRIKSNSLNAKIVENKIPQLLAQIKGLTPEMLDMHLIVQGSKQHKQYDPRTTVVVDDSPYNIAGSPALLGIAPRWMPWSCSENAHEIMKGRRIIEKNSLVEVNQCIYLLTAYLLGYVDI